MATLLLNGNALSIPLADNSVHCVVTSPPYWGLRDYGIDDQLGLEPTPELYVSHMVEVFREVKRVLRDDGTCWLNIGDSYNANTGSGFNGQKRYDDANRNTKMPIPPGLKHKDLVGIPWLVAFALRADGWWLRSDIIWHKPNPMPESVTDRPTKAHEYMFLLTKSANYFYDADAVRETTGNEMSWNEYTERIAPGATWKSGGITRYAGANKHDGGHSHPAGRNRRSVWTIATAPYSGAHFATFPPALVEPCVKAGTSERGCCPKCGSQWERVTEKTGERITTHWAPGTDRKTEIAKGRHGTTSVLTTGYQFVYETTGWRPTCQHDLDLDPIPATVFDPFAGSGTTLLVARQLGRNGIGLDLSMPYLRDQARQRLSMIALDEWTHGKKDGASVADLPMFRGAT